MTQTGENLERQPEAEVGEQSPKDAPNQLDQPIQRHQQALQAPHGLNERLIQPTRDRLPLLTAIHRRAFALQKRSEGALAWATGSELPYVRLAADPELVSAQPVEPTVPSATQFTARVVAARPSGQRTAQTGPIGQPAAMSATVQRALSAPKPEPTVHLAQAEPAFVQRTSASPALPAEASALQPAADTDSAPDQVANLASQAGGTESALSQPLQRAVARGQSALPKARLVQTMPASRDQLSAALVQRHLNQATHGATAGETTGASAGRSSPTAGTVLRRRVVGGEGESPNQPASVNASPPENRPALTVATSAASTGETPLALATGSARTTHQPPAPLTPAASPVSGPPAVQTSALGVTKAEQQVSETVRRVEQPTATSAGLGQAQSSGEPMLRQSRAIRPTVSETTEQAMRSSTSTPADSPMLHPTSALDAPIVQRQRRGTALQPMRSQAIPAAAARPTLSAQRSEDRVQRALSNIPAASDMPYVQASSGAASAPSVPAVQRAGLGAASNEAHPGQGAPSQVVQRSTTPPAPSALQPGEPLAPNSLPVIAQSQEASPVAQASGIEPAAQPPSIGQRREMGAAIVQRRLRGSALPTSPVQPTAPVAAQAMPAAEAEPVLRRSRPVSVAGMAPTSPMAEGGSTPAPSVATASATVAKTEGNLSAASGQRQRQTVIAPALQRQPRSTAVAEPTAVPVDLQLRRNASLPSHAALSHAPTASAPSVGTDLPVAGGQSNVQTASAPGRGEGSSSQLSADVVTPLPVAPAAPALAETVLRRLERPVDAGSTQGPSLQKARSAPDAPPHESPPAGMLRAAESGANLSTTLVQRYLGNATGQTAQPSLATPGANRLAPFGEPVLRTSRASDASADGQADGLPTSGTVRAAAMAGVNRLAPYGEPVLHTSRASDASSAPHADGLPTSVTAVAGPNVGNAVVQSQFVGIPAQPTPQPVYALARRSIVAGGMENLGRALIRRQGVGRSGLMLKRGESSAEPETGSEMPVARAEYAPTDIYQGNPSAAEGFNSTPPAGDGIATQQTALPLAHPKVQTKLMGQAPRQDVTAAPSYANSTPAMPLQRAPTISAPSPAMPSSASSSSSSNSSTNSGMGQTSNTVSQANTPEIDLERLANAVYQIIERRLIRERESMGL